MALDNAPEVRGVTNKLVDLKIVSPRENDSLGTTTWKEYLDRDKLRSAWAVPEGSPYAGSQKTKTIDSVNQWANIIKPRYSSGEQTSEQGVDNLIKSGQLDTHTAVILDSGGPHGVAMAVRLAEQGYQPVIMFDAEVFANGVNESQQELATLLYFAEKMRVLKAQGKFGPDSPPVFVLDAHRDDLRINDSFRDNTYSYQPHDFPTSEELRQRGINKIVYLNEGDREGRIEPGYQSMDRLPPDLMPSVQSWVEAGTSMLYTGVDPWKSSRENTSGLPPSQGLFRGFGRRIFGRLSAGASRLSY